MAKRRTRKQPKVEVIELEQSPCDLANIELRKTYGGAFEINREIYEELSEYREFIDYKTNKNTAEVRKWLLGMNDISRRLMNKMVSEQSIRTMCTTCGNNTIEVIRTNIYNPLAHVLKVCDKYNPEIK